MNTWVPPTGSGGAPLKTEGGRCKASAACVSPSPIPVFVTDCPVTPSLLRHNLCRIPGSTAGANHRLHSVVRTPIPCTHVQSVAAHSHSPEVSRKSVGEVLPDAADRRLHLACSGLSRGMVRGLPTTRSQLSTNPPGPAPPVCRGGCAPIRWADRCQHTSNRFRGNLPDREYLQAHGIVGNQTGA